MPLTARDTVGFERNYNKCGFPSNPVDYEGTVGTTYTKGRLAVIENPSATTYARLVSVTSASVIGVGCLLVGVIAETKICTAADNKVRVFDNPFEVFKVSFVGHVDQDVTAGAAATVTTALSGAVSVANILRGSLLHIYAGPGKGDIRTIEANTNANPSVITVSPAFSATPTVASKVIILAVHDGVGTFTPGVNIGITGLLVSAASAAKAAIAVPGANTGYLNIVSIEPAKLVMNVMISPAKHCFLAGRTAV